MLIEFGGRKHSTFLSGLLDRIRGAAVRWNELQRLDRREFEAIAHELNLSGAELAALAFTPSSAVESLGRRLAHAGFSENELVASHSDVLRDLRRVCSQCSYKARCARDLRHERRATPAKYCPNEQTLRALACEARRSSSYVLPFPARRN